MGLSSASKKGTIISGACSNNYRNQKRTKTDTWIAAFIKQVLPRLFSPTRPLATSFDIILSKKRYDYDEENKNG